MWPGQSVVALDRRRHSGPLYLDEEMPNTTSLTAACVEEASLPLSLLQKPRCNLVIIRLDRKCLRVREFSASRCAIVCPIEASLVDTEIPKSCALRKGNREDVRIRDVAEPTGPTGWSELLNNFGGLSDDVPRRNCFFVRNSCLASEPCEVVSSPRGFQIVYESFLRRYLTVRSCPISFGMELPRGRTR